MKKNVYLDTKTYLGLGMIKYPFCVVTRCEGKRMRKERRRGILALSKDKDP